MDIRRWLVETVEHSDEDSHHRSDSHHQHKNDSHHHKRGATPIAKVPVGVPPRHEPDHHKERRHKRKISEARSASAVTSCSSDSCTTSDSSSSSSAPSEHFERRQRHKTRKDLYEPHSGVRKKRTKPDDKAEAKAKKRRKKKEKEHRRTEKKKRRVKRPGQDFHENFTAKNVRDDRLTLKPQPMLGLLKKGRASSPTKPRGLPDLVFSEMQFLKKPRPSIELSGRAEEITKSEKKRGKKNNKVEEEEVSAYFGMTKTHERKEHDEISRRTSTPATTSSKPRSAAVRQKERVRDIPTRRTAIVEDPRRTQSESPRHTLRSRTSNISTVRATSSTARLSNIVAEARQLNQVQPNADFIADTAITGQKKSSVTMQVACSKTIMKDVDSEEPLHHDNDALQKKPSGNQSVGESSKTMDAQTAATRVEPAGPVDPLARPHNSPMAKLLQACQTSVYGVPARPHSHSNDDNLGMESLMARQPKYAAGDGVILVDHRANDQPGIKGFRFAQPRYIDQNAVSVSPRRAGGNPGMKDFKARQPNYRYGESVRLPPPDNLKPSQHTLPRYTAQHGVSMAPHPLGIELMQEPHNGSIQDLEHEQTHAARPAHYLSYDHHRGKAHHEHQPHRFDQQQQHYQQHRHNDEYANVELQAQYASKAPPHPQYRPHAHEAYDDHYFPDNPYDEETHLVDDQIPQYNHPHDEQYHYSPQPLFEEPVYHEDYGQQDMQIYQDFNTGYMVQEQDMHMPQQQYRTPYYDMRDTIDMEMEQQIAEEEMMEMEHSNIEKLEDEENEESRGFVPNGFWQPRKRR